jgi:hypothetical protein
VLVIVTSHRDEEARWVADRWAAHDARLLTCEDLSLAGWRHQPGAPADSTAVIGGMPVPVPKITGVLTRRPRIFEWEPIRTVRGDRAYVAAEMTAFLRSWLADLECPVLNRPASTCLSGPGWRREQWAYTAARLGIPVQPVTYHLDPGSDITEENLSPPEENLSPPDVTVTVVGAMCLGTADNALAGHARRLAAAAGVDLLAVRFGKTVGGFHLHDADPWPAISSPEVADAILEHVLLLRSPREGRVSFPIAGAK